MRIQFNHTILGFLTLIFFHSTVIAQTQSDIKSPTPTPATENSSPAAEQPFAPATVDSNVAPPHDQAPTSSTDQEAKAPNRRAIAPAPSFLVIVNSKNAISNVDKKFLSDAFLKKTTRWGTNEVIRPVDKRSDSVIRRRFSETILNRSIAEVKNYWQQRIFAGYDLPPPELDIDSEIVKYVVKYPGAIGYISGDANIQNSNVKILTVK